jgi:hypothetical protein
LKGVVLLRVLLASPIPAAGQARRPTATIYYLGVPDTTPEFTSEAALSAYLQDALAKVQRAAQGQRP